MLYETTHLAALGSRLGRLGSLLLRRLGLGLRRGLLALLGGRRGLLGSLLLSRLLLRSLLRGGVLLF